MLRLAVADGALKVNPADGVDRPSVRSKRERRALSDPEVSKVISDPEVSKVISAAESVDSGMAPMVWLMARAGLRVGEVLALKRSDVDLASRVLTIRGSMSRREGVRPV